MSELEHLNERGQAFRRAKCDSHGPYESVRLWGGHWSACAACEQERRDRSRVESEQAQERARIDEWLTAAGLRGRYRDCTFDTFDCTSQRQRDVLKACQSFVESLEPRVWRSLWLVGPPGVGKTHLASAMAHAAIVARRMRAVVTTPREMVRELRATWRRDADQSEDQVIDRFAQVGLLILDEIGVGFGSEGELVQLFDVLDRRYQLRRPTALTSNLPVPAIREALGERLFDRLREGSQVLQCDWASHRGRAAEGEGR